MKINRYIVIFLSFILSTETEEVFIEWNLFDSIQTLNNCPLIFSNIKSEIILSFPVLNDKMKYFKMYKSPVMPKILSEKYSTIYTYTGIGIDDPSELVSLTIYGDNVMAMIHSSDGKVFIDKNENSLFRVANNELGDSNSKYICEHSVIENRNRMNRSEQFDECIGENEPCYIMGDKLITYRIAMIMTEAVTNSVADGTVEGGLAWIVSMVNKLNLLWRRELSFQFELIPNNDILVFTNDNPAPTGINGFADTNCSNPDPKYCEINNVEPYLELVIGPGGLNATDDIRLWEYGLVLNTTYNGGVAQAPGPISANNPTYEVLNHELGHNLGSAHNITIENGYRSSLGGTIMGSRTRTSIGSIGDQYSLHTIEIGYKNMNTLTNDPAYADAYAYLNGFKSIETDNIIPEISVPVSGFYIPKETPFVLEGSATPFNSNYLFSWEQNDPSSISFCMDLSRMAGECDGLSEWPATEGPLFSTVDLSFNGNKRYFPSMISLLKNEYITTFNDYGTLLTVERLPFATRDINMRLQVRTNQSEGSAINFNSVKFSVYDESGPFRVTSQVDSISWLSGSEQLVTWDIAYSDLPPINCSNVDILLSKDAGRNFDVVLINNTSNDGSENINVPLMANTDSCRIMVKAVDNIFFDINNSYISIVNSNIPNILLNKHELYIEVSANNQIQTEFTISNDGEPGSVLSYSLNFIDSIYIFENFDNTILDENLNTTEYTLPENWQRSSNGRGWIIGTEEISAWPFDMGDFYFDIPNWSRGNYAYTDDGQYNICPSCIPSLDCELVNGCIDGSLDFLLSPLISIPEYSIPQLSFYSYSFYEEYFDHNNILQIFTEDNSWVNIDILSHDQNEFILKEYDLLNYSGKDIKIRFHSQSAEPAVWNAGWAIDDVKINSSPKWLSAIQSNGSLVSGQSDDIKLEINTIGLEMGGVYDSEIIIHDEVNNIIDTLIMTIKIIEGILGCTDINACNYNSESIEDDGSCTYPVENYDCLGNPLLLLQDVIPSEFSILGAFPNPFNPITNIKFSINETSNVKVILYDIAGKRLEILTNEIIYPGYHEVVWNAKKYSSGIYIVKIISGKNSISKKLMLIK